MEAINKEQNFISAVVYVHNSDKYLETFLISLKATLLENFLYSEIILVNDASTDSSVEIISENNKSSSNQMIKVLTMSYNHGVEESMNAGVDLSIGDFVFEFDSVFVDYNWELLMKIYNNALDGFVDKWLLSKKHFQIGIGCQ